MKENTGYDGSINEAVRSFFGESVSIRQMRSVPGGDINRAFCAQLSDGGSIFVKMNTIENEDFFRTEALGLEALRSTKTIEVPQIYGFGTDREKGESFLFMEYLERTPQMEDFWETFGHELAALHRSDCLAWARRGAQRGRYGFVEDNFIGFSPQINSPVDSWIDFFREYRLLPQIRRAEKYFDSALRKKADRLLDRLDVLLRKPEFPSLLHGDLWSGNMICGPDGKAWIIDPAVYVGDFETDLAMTQLFGSLPERFYDAYQEVNPIDQKGYARRRYVYDLYHLLNHLNMFGRGYLSEVSEIIEYFV